MASILNQIFTSFNDVFQYATEYHDTYFRHEFIQGQKKVKTDIERIMEKEKTIEAISPDVALSEVKLQASEVFQREDYINLKKPESATDLETLQKQADSIVDEAQLKGSMVRRGTIN